MPSETKTRSVEQSAPEEGYAPGEITEHLNEILTSSPFRTSRQCKDLLRYLVEHSQGKDDGSLRERVIGVQVFGRDAAYDTNGDPVVRIRVADVRKRLAQFYQAQELSPPSLHLDLLPGSYRVRFRHMEPLASLPHLADPVDTVQPGEDGPALTSVEPVVVAAPVAASAVPPALAVPEGAPERLHGTGRPARWVGWVFGAAGLLALVALLAVALVGRARTTPQQRFWAPLTGTDQPVLVYLGSNMAYIFSPDFLSRYRATHGLPNNGPEFPVDLSVVKTVDTKDLLPIQDTFVTTADLSAAVALTAQLRDWKKPFVLRVARDLSIGDLRNRPTLLVGGFNNPWTLQITDALPFALREGSTIQERDGPRRHWSVGPHTQDSTQEDYALITRLLHSATGGPSIAVAGIGQYGTQAAAELLTDPERVRGLLQTAPRGWEMKNLQIVLRVKVLQFEPVGTEIVAERFW